MRYPVLAIVLSLSPSLMSIKLGGGLVGEYCPDGMEVDPVRAEPLLILLSHCPGVMGGDHVFDGRG